MVGMWRGIMVKEQGATKFEMGEIDAHFENKTASFKIGETVTKYTVSTTAGDTFTLQNSDGETFRYTNSLVGNLRYTTAMGLTTYGNATYPDSFALGMRSNDTTNFVMF